MTDRKEMRKLMEAVEQLGEYGNLFYAYGMTSGGNERRSNRKPTNGKPLGSGNIRQCGNCGGHGHFSDEDEPLDNEYCIICAGTRKVAMKGDTHCKACGGYGHFADSDDEISDDDYCFDCAGTGLVAKGHPEYNPDLDGTLEPPPER